MESNHSHLKRIRRENCTIHQSSISPVEQDIIHLDIAESNTKISIELSMGEKGVLDELSLLRGGKT
jgi:hypothetical protein